MLMIAPTVFASIFNNDPDLVNYTGWAIRIYMAGIFAMGFQLVCQQSFMALGQAKVSLLLACLRKIVLLIPLIFLLPTWVGEKGVLFVQPIADAISKNRAPSECARSWLLAR